MKILETVSFICTVYEHPTDLIKRVIDSIDNVMQYCPFFDYEIIIWANGDNSHEYLEYEKLSDSVKVYSDHKNFGYCGGNNRAVRYSKGGYLIITNPDIIFTESLCIDWLVGTSKMHNCISGRLIGTESWYTYAASFPTDQKYEPDNLPFFYDQPTLSMPGKWKAFKYIDGCLFCIPRSLWDDIGGFDENVFPGYFGENILCYKAFSKGYTIKECNIEKMFKHAGGVKSPIQMKKVKTWSKEGREYFYQEYALKDWDNFIKYLNL